MQWTEDLSVGIESIDRQHRELFARLDRLVDAVRQGKCRYIVESTIGFLEGYAAAHFADEERYMERTSYPAYPRHKGQHAEFLERISRLKAVLAEEGHGSYPLSVATIQMASDWIREHISFVDKELGIFLREHREALT